MKIYKDSNNLFWFNNDILPVGSLGMSISDNSVSIWNAVSKVLIFSGPVTNITDSTGTSYASVSAFLTACSDFFVKAPSGSGTGGGATPVLSASFVANGTDDGNGNITGLQDFQLPSDVNTTYPIFCIDGGLMNLAFTVNATTKMAHFTMAPLAGSIYFIYFK